MIDIYKDYRKKYNNEKERKKKIKQEKKTRI